MRDYLISFPMFGKSFTINPPAYFSIGSFKIYYYGVIIAAGFLLAVIYCSRRSRQFGITQDNIIDMLILAVPMAVIFTRLYYCIFNWSYYAANPAQILNFRDGGLAIYGGIIGAVLAVYIFCRYKKIPTGAMLDMGCFGLLIGQAVGRWGNFMNREAYGSATDVFCRMGLTNPASGETIYVHPTFLYESLWNFVGLIALHIISKKKKRKFDGELFIYYIGWYGLGRFFIEGLRTDSLYFGSTDIRVSQVVAALSVVAAIVLTIIFYRRSKSPLWVDNPANPLNVSGDSE